MVKCPPIEKGGYSNFGEVLNKLTEVIGMYGSCARQHNELVDFLKEEQ